MGKPGQTLGFYATPPHDCNYLDGRKAITLFADPRFPKSKRLYTALTSIGFRRSGEHIYQPHCGDCRDCISVRVAVKEFRKNRTQKRNWALNQDLTVKTMTPQFKQDHYHMYHDYIAARHSGGGMEAHTPETYMDFLSCSWAETCFYEFRLSSKLVAVAVVDYLDNALSAVYTFFDPEYEKRSLGRFAVLYQLELAKRHDFPWVYLGYWIEECRKMSYKNEYQPLEYFIENEWKLSV